MYTNHKTGIPRKIQMLRLKPKRTRKEKKFMRDWLKSYRKTNDPRPETIESYTV
jgi:hypothetical protein